MNTPHVIPTPHVILTLNAVKGKDLPGYGSMMRSFAPLRMTGVMLRMTAVFILLLLLASCQQQDEPAPAEQALTIITTRATLEAGSQTYIGGELNLVIETEEGQTVELKYNNDNDGNGWVLATGSAPLLVNAKPYSAYAYGYVGVPWGIDDSENMLVTWTGPLTPTVTGTGTAQAELTLTPANACFHVTLMGAYGEPKPLEGFQVTPGVKEDAWDANGPIWSIPTDPYTTPRTLEISEDKYGWSLSNSPQSYAIYPAGQTIAAGQTLFTIVAIDGTEEAELYGTAPYTVLSPATFTLEAGKRYKYTLRMDGMSHTATIEDITITDFDDDGATTNLRPYRGIASAQDLVDFAKDFNTLGHAAAMERWTDEEVWNGTISLLNDIDMKDTEGFAMIGNGAGNYFPGTFDGRGFTISNLKVETTNSDAAMFYTIDRGATVKNLHLREAGITANEGVAGIAYDNYGTINGCTVHGTVKGSYIGGIANTNFDTGKIIACGFRGTLIGVVSINGTVYANRGIILGCYDLGEDDKLTDAEMIALNNDLYRADEKLHWVRKTSTDMVTMPGKEWTDVKCTIATADELLAFANAWNAGKGNGWLDADGTVHLAADIDLPDGTPWPMIGTNIRPFTATFDGHGHTVSGVQGSGSDFGFFYVIDTDGNVQNLVVKVEVDVFMYAGGIAITNNGTISGCGVQGTVKSSGGNPGGIARENGGTISGCYSVAKVTGNSGNVGSIAGYNSGSITNCYWYYQPGVTSRAVGSGSTATTTTPYYSEEETIAAWNNR